MADGAEVLAGIRRLPGVRYAALTPNLRGYEGAREAKADEVAIFASASEGFSRANLNCSISESIERFRPVMDAAKADNMQVRGYVSMVTDCPFEGKIAPSSVASVVAQLRDLGCHEVSLGDTVGRGVPETIDRMLAAVLEELPAARLAGHYHDTGGRAVENVEVSLGGAGCGSLTPRWGAWAGAPMRRGQRAMWRPKRSRRGLRNWGSTQDCDPVLLADAAEFAKSLRTR